MLKNWRSGRRILMVTVVTTAFAGLWLDHVAAGPYLVCYYPGYSNTNTYPYAMIDYNQMTLIAHAFIWANANGTLNTTSDFSFYPQLVQSAHAHGVKIIVSVGGSVSPTNFSSMVANLVARTNFVANLTAFCVSNNYDGADFDWEAPASTADKTNFTLLAQETRAAFNAATNANPPLTVLTAAVKPTSSSGQWLDVNGLKTNLSWFGVMTYDFYGTWSTHSGLAEPLYPAPGDPEGSGYAVDSAINYYQSRGAALTNLFSGINFDVTQFTSTNLFAVTNGPSTSLVYSNAILDLTNGWTQLWNTNAFEPYAVNPAHTLLTTYENSQSAQAKADYTVGRRLGGMIVWVWGEDLYAGQPQLMDVLGPELLGVTNLFTYLDSFEGSLDFFNSSPTASPSTVGISTNSTAALTNTVTYGGTNSLMLILKDDPSSSSNWAVRFLSNGGNPAGQPNIGTNGYVGFWLNTTAANLSVGISVYDSVGIERSVSLPVVGNGKWYRYEWNLAGGASQWASWSNGNGVVNGPVVTIDAIWFYAPNGSPNMTIYLDDVYQLNFDTHVGAPVAVAGTNQTVGTSNTTYTVTLIGSASSTRLLQWLDYQWTQIAGPTVSLVNPTNLVSSFTYSGLSPTNIVLQFQFTVNDGLFTVDDVTTVTLLANASPPDPFSVWQQQYFGSTNCANCSGDADYDGTGMSNTNKFLTGFNPTNSAANLQILGIGATNGTDVDVTYLGANGDNTWSPGIASRTNLLDYTTGDASGDYTNGGWQDTGQTNILSGGNGMGMVTNMVDSGGATNFPSRYYRVRVLP
jgi:GH18 family chitinase